MNVREIQSRIAPRDERAAEASRRRWNDIAKPLNGLGMLESAITRIAALTGSADVKLDRRAVVMLCADNGVVAEGVSQTGPEVTAIVAGNAARAKSSVCHMARRAGAEVFPVDVGMLTRAEGVRDLHISNGTKSFLRGPAMARPQAERAIELGIELVRELKEQGYQILVTGEMGIGNTTTSAAVTSVLLGLAPEEVTGRGAGLNDERLMRKRQVVRAGIELNKPDVNDPIDVLSKVGGYDIAAMAGVFIGGGIYRVPIVIDGLISSVAALCAARLCPACSVSMLASHLSSEPGADMILKELGLEAPIRAGLHLGEGTGGVCLLPLLDMALGVYSEMPTFGDISVDAYQPNGGK